MKKLIILCFLARLTFAGTLQGQSVRFFAPVPDQLFQITANSPKALVNPSVWLFRPAIAVTAVQLNWNKDTKSFDAAALNSAGMGIGYQHFIEVNGLPYNNYGLNAILLLGADIGQTEPATMAIALTGSFLQFVNIGGLYNITYKSFGILTGVTIKF